MIEQMRGIYTIPPVVYHDDLSVDCEGTSRAVRFCLDCGSHGLVMPVYASEYFVLSVQERKAVLEATIKECAGTVPVVAGISAGYVAEAVDLAKHAEAAGANAVIAAPPHIVKVSMEELKDYYRQINDAVHIPVFIQNLFPPLGTPMTVKYMLDLVNSLENVCYIKEETARAPYMILELSEYMKNTPDCRLKGVMAGNGARNLISEYTRGACGTMPPAQFADLAVAVWELLEAGKTEEAMRVHAQCLPAFIYGGTYGVGCYKYILTQRGLDINPICRPANWPPLDEQARQELRRILALVDGLIRVRY
ncbi:MAG: dihydrodipicolinate synthase family protein [Candidatus Heteroscillospira sp.]|jgi:4-hydroxy-tetrahydrodipicolinate synthase